jgi:hypothetical protein
MTELDQVWSQMLESATVKALDSGRSDLVAYLRLKAANDAIRIAGVNWLFDSLIEIAADVTRRGQLVSIERKEPHNHRRGNSNMVGSLVQIRLGVRCLMLEAGWTRTPTDGIMRGGMLAAARISHFGMPKVNADLSLAYAGDLPIWHLEDEDGKRTPFRICDLQSHFDIFLGL